ncbi:hypothetical protein RDABS01_024870 [Bienertia sinuspersici]
MHMNEDKQHMEDLHRHHAVSESRLQRDLETHHLKVKTSTKEVVGCTCKLKQYLQDLDVVLYPRLAEHVKFDEKEEAIAFGKHDVDGKCHLVRGPVQPRDVWNDRDIAKRETFCPVGVSSWHKLKKKMKADIVILVRWFFSLENIV